MNDTPELVLCLLDSWCLGALDVHLEYWSFGIDCNLDRLHARSRSDRQLLCCPPPRSPAMRLGLSFARASFSLFSFPSVFRSFIRFHLPSYSFILFYSIVRTATRSRSTTSCKPLTVSRTPFAPSAASPSGPGRCCPVRTMPGSWRGRGMTGFAWIQSMGILPVGLFRTGIGLRLTRDRLANARGCRGDCGHGNESDCADCGE